MDQRRDLVNGMDDDPETIRQRGMDMAGETLHMLRQRQEEQEQRLHAPQGSAGEPEWTPPTLGPAEPVRRAPARRERPPPAPPSPDQYTRIAHDTDGRIVATERYTGAGAAAARSWEGWVRSVLKAEIATVYEVVWDTVGTATGEITREERAKTDKIVAALTRRVEELEQRLAGDRQSKEYRNAAD